MQTEDSQETVDRIRKANLRRMGNFVKKDTK